MKALVPLRGRADDHRGSTPPDHGRDADRVILVDGGRLVDIAPFNELAARHAQLRVTAG